MFAEHLAEGRRERALYLEQDRAWANVVAQCLCKPSGTNRNTGDSSDVGLMESKRQHDEAVSGCSGGVSVASCFPGSELQVGSRADVARTNAMISNSESRGLMGGQRQQQGQRPATQGGRFEGAGGPGSSTLWPEVIRGKMACFGRYWRQSHRRSSGEFHICGV